LFIDEAYSLVATRSEDPYGHEAVQALLKRAEDERERLVIILAGYPDEMEDLLKSNPGLSSRFSRQLNFVDYTPLEIAGIFGLFSRKNRYDIAPAARLKIMQGFKWLYDRRDRHFGNGRAARNLFEQAIRCMANRLAGIEEITEDQLQLLVAEDIQFEEVPESIFTPIDDNSCRVHITCDKCEHEKDIPAEFLGKKVVCPKCKQQFGVEWGTLLHCEEPAENSS
ncbi:MAG: AAA family ATPase, partial [Aeoliella sp.]